MPTIVNLRGGGIQLGTYLTVSIVYRAYASVTDRTIEVPVGTARYLSVDLFSARNAGGTMYGTATLGIPAPLLEWSHTTTVDDALAAIFPPPGPDT